MGRLNKHQCPIEKKGKPKYQINLTPQVPIDLAITDTRLQYNMQGVRARNLPNRSQQNKLELTKNQMIHMSISHNVVNKVQLLKIEQYGKTSTVLN